MGLVFNKLLVILAEMACSGRGNSKSVSCLHSTKTSIEHVISMLIAEAVFSPFSHSTNWQVAGRTQSQCYHRRTMKVITKKKNVFGAVNRHLQSSYVQLPFIDCIIHLFRLLSFLNRIVLRMNEIMKLKFNLFE